MLLDAIIIYPPALPLFSSSVPFFFAFAKAILKIPICTFSFSNTVVVYPTHFIIHTNTRTYTYTRAHIHMFLYCVPIVCKALWWILRMRFLILWSLHLVTKIRKMNQL